MRNSTLTALRKKKVSKTIDKRGNNYPAKYEHRQPPSKKKSMITKLVKIHFLLYGGEKKKESTIFWEARPGILFWFKQIQAYPLHIQLLWEIF
jgi:hypothetical protein